MSDAVDSRSCGQDQDELAWAEALKRVHAQYPSTERLDWKRVFEQDQLIFGSILDDIMKVDALVA